MSDEIERIRRIKMATTSLLDLCHERLSSERAAFNFADLCHATLADLTKHIAALELSPDSYWRNK